MKPNHCLSNPAFSLLLCAFLSVCAQAQPAYTELISPNKQANGGFGKGCGGLPDLTGDGVGEFWTGQESPNVVHVYDGSSLEHLYSIRPAVCGFGFHAISSAGDVNGDGISELMLGLSCADGIGHVMVADGKTGANLFMLNSPNPVGQGYFGSGHRNAVHLLPDMNGDGKEDWLIHQLEYASSVGRAYIFDSQTRRVIRTIQNTGTGFTFHLQNVGVIPDVDADGKPELLVSAPLATVVRDGRTIANSGRAIVRSLQSGQVLYELHDPEPKTPGGFGNELRGIGDITGDGIGDIAVATAIKDNNTGIIYLFSGADGRWLRTVRSPNPRPTGRLGWVIESLPDLNGDGVPELFTQEHGFGLAHVYDGATSTVLKTIEFPGPAGGPFGLGTVRQMTPPGLRAFLFSSGSAGESNEGRVYYMPFTPIGPARLKALGKTASGFRLQVTDEPGHKLEIQSSSDFKSWEPVATVTTGTEPVEVEDSTAARQPQRFYRAVQRE